MRRELHNVSICDPESLRTGLPNYSTEEENDEADEEDDEDGLQVDEIEVDGKEYLFNPATGEVYDYEVYANTEEIEVIGSYGPESEELSLN